jgi:hypothetical protein
MDSRCCKVRLLQALRPELLASAKNTITAVIISGFTSGQRKQRSRKQPNADGMRLPAGSSHGSPHAPE